MRILIAICAAFSIAALPATPSWAEAGSADDGTISPGGSGDGWAYETGGELVVSGGLAVNLPAALPTGLATGVGVGFSYGRSLAWGARLSVTTVTEASEAWNVTHRDWRPRVFGAYRHAVGRGTLSVRLGLGGALVFEDRVRHQGMRAGLEGDALATSAVALLPVASLEGAVQLHVLAGWSMLVSGGPTVTLDDGARAGWSAEIGVAWQPFPEP